MHLRLTAATALLSVALLSVALRLGWLGADTGVGSEFCERARPGDVAQPANTFSNLGFVVAGLLVAWHATRTRLHGTLGRFPVLATGYACIVVLLGPASAAMHATQSAVGGVLDLTSMYLIAAFAAAYALMRWWHRGPTWFAVVFLGLLAFCQTMWWVPAEIPLVRFAGNLAFGVLLTVALLVEYFLARRGDLTLDLRYAAAALACMVVAFAIWTASQHGLCDPDSLLQGHAAWHLLGAAAAYFLYRLYASERQPD